MFIWKTHTLDILETPVTVTPQQDISKTLDSSKIPQKYLTFSLGERTFTFGEITFTFREITFTFGDNRGFGVLGISFLLLGVLGLRVSGGP